MSRGMEMNRLIAQANTPGVLADELAESGQAGQDAREGIAPAEPSAPDDDRA